MPEYILIIIICFAVAYILVSVIECLTAFRWVNYWHDGKVACVFWEPIAGRGYNLFEEKTLSYTFKKNEDGKWKYTKDNLQLKERIIAFGILFILMAWLCHVLEERQFPSIWPILQSIVISFFLSFTSMVTEPLEAYVMLHKDLRKNSRSDDQGHVR